MSGFRHSFEVRAPVEAVAAFYQDARVLRQLSPPPMIVQLHRVDPLAEGSIVDMTLWLGPVPIHWVADHRDVDRAGGFLDIQTQGPMKVWRHRHSYGALGPRLTWVRDEVEFEHFPGWRGLLTRMLFSPLSLRFLFFYRAQVTRRIVERRAQTTPVRAQKGATAAAQDLKGS
jgi:ligand-binding SRPBCC domain-containing protein